MDGNFSVKANSGQELVFSYIGYKRMELKAAQNMNILMTSDSELLSEVVVVGYVR